MNEIFSNWLFSGELNPLHLTAGNDNYVYLRVPKNIDFDYIYSQRQYKEPNIVRGDSFKYAGVYCKADGIIYDGQYELRGMFDSEDYYERSAEKLQASLQAEVRGKVEAAIGNDRSRLDITELTDARQLKRLQEFIKYTASGEAREAYLDTAEYEGFTYRCRYSPQRWTEDSLLAYITDPEEYAAREAAVYIEACQEDMLSDFLTGDAVAVAYREIIADTENPVHYIKRIMAAVGDSDARTVNVSIVKDGQEFTFKTEAAQLRRDCGSYYSAYNIVAADRRKFENTFGRNANFTPEEIASITYGRKELYAKGE